MTNGANRPVATPFHVLLVCTANQCRSPMAERLLARAQSSLGLGWTVSSAGTAARDGYPMHPLAVRTLLDYGIADDDWTSRRLTADIVARADLILTAAVDHRRTVVTVEPRAITRTYPLLQFARFAAQVSRLTDGRYPGPALLARAAVARGGLQPVAPGGDDLTDPIGHPLRSFRSCAATLQTAINQICRPPSMARSKGG